MRKIDEGLGKLDSTPVEFAGVAILAVPGTPEYSAVNPDTAQTLRLLSQREAYWRSELAKYEKRLTEARNRLDPGYSGSETDDFGESHPMSLPRRQDAERANAARRQDEARALGAEIDRLASDIRGAVPGADLPALSGLDLKGMQDALEAYPDKLNALSLSGQDSPQLFKAKMALLGIGKLLPYAGRAVISQSRSDKTISTIEDVKTNTLPKVQTGLQGIVDLVNAILRDIDSDRAYLQGGSHDAADNRALLERKRALLTSAMRPRLAAAQAMVRDTLIPFQRDQIKSADPEGESYAKLLKAQIKLYEASKKAVETTLPWALASGGAREGDTASALANIESAKAKYRKFITGYDDERGRHTGIDEHLFDIARRKDPNESGTEVIYGETQPFSLPRKIALYSEEKLRRLAQINQADAEINSVLERIDAMTGGRHGLLARRLPVAIPEGQAGVGIIQRLVDDKTLEALGDTLTQLGNEYKAKAGEVSLGGGDQ
ncbi:MAG: hypothetical protein AAB339_07725, partial [Elusimicrobiota bacterium]